MTVDEARRIAAEALPRLFPSLSVPCRIDDTATRLVRGHWVFFWNSVDFLDTGDDENQMMGNLPIVVRDSDGEVVKADIRRTLEEQLAEDVGR